MGYCGPICIFLTEGLFFAGRKSPSAMGFLLSSPVYHTVSAASARIYLNGSPEITYADANSRKE